MRCNDRRRHKRRRGVNASRYRDSYRAGIDIAIESADIILTRSDLSDVIKALKISKATIRNVKQNLFWAFIYNIIGIPISFGILYPVNGFLLNPMIAALAMSLSSISVVLNALRLNLFKPDRKAKQVNCR